MKLAALHWKDKECGQQQLGRRSEEQVRHGNDVNISTIALFTPEKAEKCLKRLRMKHLKLE